jgi:hypothetical protein
MGLIVVVVVEEYEYCCPQYEIIPLEGEIK